MSTIQIMRSPPPHKARGGITQKRELQTMLLNMAQMPL
jgi:hypothetical protein